MPPSTTQPDLAPSGTQPDLATAEPPDLLQCPRCERHVAPIDDDGDLLCGRCRLVLYAG